MSESRAFSRRITCLEYIIYLTAILVLIKMARNSILKNIFIKHVFSSLIKAPSLNESLTNYIE